MRKAHYAVVTFGLLSIAAGVGIGCQDRAGDCEKNLKCSTGSGGSGGSTSSSSGTGGSASGTGGGGSDPGCAGDPTMNAAIVKDDCGTFVSASAMAGGDGTKAKPFQTFAEAITAGAQRLYVCAETYNETTEVGFTGGVAIYAGFTDCTETGWTWMTASKATLNAPADKVGLKLSGGTNHVENLDVVAASATVAGGSSVALLQDGGTLTLVNGNLTAGDALAGDPGAAIADDPALDGTAGDPGVPLCSAGANNPGPPGKTKVCSDGSSVGGNGGDGGGFVANMPAPAGGGTDGSPADPNQMTKGKGGAGEAGSICVDGTSGVPGVVGGSGTGAVGNGTISAMTPYLGVKGTDGLVGKPGQGGGGGGGAKGGKSINCAGVTTDRIGASGGAGGTGGCGGNGGNGGNPGGSSIALLSIAATVTLQQSTLTAGKGGNGGNGGNGQAGGNQALGGAFGAGAGGTNASCQGGNGGKGGNGGPAGGGQGGHSLCVAFTGTAPTGGTCTPPDTANKGTGGLGGTGNDTAGNGKGADGMAVECWDFTTDAACM